MLLGLGIHELSMSAVSVPEVKATIRQMTRAGCEELVAKVTKLATAAEVRALVSDYVLELAARKDRA
jgi:phosphoenolpyruvate-protein kinase (PTS system EI component)